MWRPHSGSRRSAARRLAQRKGGHRARTAALQLCVHTGFSLLTPVCGLRRRGVAIYVNDPSAWPQAVALTYISPFRFMLRTYALRLARTMISTTTTSTISSKR